MKSRKPPIKLAEDQTINECERELRLKLDDIEGVYKDFQDYVRIEYGFTREIEGIELLHALKCFMGLMEFRGYEIYLQDIMKDPRRTHKKFLRKNHERLADILQAKYLPGDDINFDDICKIILQEFDKTDKRTHKAYADALCAHNILIEILKYDSYYFKEMPKLSKTEEKALGIVLTQNQKAILKKIPYEGVMVDKLSIAIGIRTSKLKPILMEMVEDGLISNPMIGKFKLTDVGAAAL